MKTEGKKDMSIKNVAKLLKFLDKQTNLKDPNQVKWFIAQHEVSRVQSEILQSHTKGSPNTVKSNGSNQDTQTNQSPYEYPQESN